MPRIKTLFKIKNIWERVFLLVFLFGLASIFIKQIFDFDLINEYVHPLISLSMIGYFVLFIIFFMFKIVIDVLDADSPPSILRISFKIVFPLSSISGAGFLLPEILTPEPIFPSTLTWKLYLYWGLASIYPILLLSRFYIFPELRKD